MLQQGEKFPSLLPLFFFFFFFSSGSDYKAFNGKRLDNIKDKVFSKPHDVPTETTEYGVRERTIVEYNREIDNRKMLPVLG